MPLIALAKADPKTVAEFSIKQIVGIAGDGNLKDSSECSVELRQYLMTIPSQRIGIYIDQCLSESFDKSGQVLQDLVNEFGRRLDYEVENGFYGGRVNAIGNDGLWLGPDGHSIVVEVKTTDAYRISLDVIATYRDKLIESGKITARSSILVVVGRQDTGDLEAQVRGSKHAWDLRLISADALAKLVALKEDSDELETIKKIRGILIPIEYTRVDALVDVVFTTAKDIEADDRKMLPAVNGSSESSDLLQVETVDKGHVAEKRGRILDVIARKFDSVLLKKTRATYWSTDHSIRFVCTISKRYEKGSDYWYAFHPSWHDFLKEGVAGYFVLGCSDLQRAFAIPLSELERLLPKFSTTTTKGETYWHILLNETSQKTIQLMIPHQKPVSLEQFAIAL